MNYTALPARPTLIQRFQRSVAARAEARRNGESGLALLDVLLGMAIFGIIVIIGIQSVQQFRQRAFETTANSDAKQLSVGLEGYFTDTQAYPGTQAALEALFAGYGTTTAASSSSSLGVNLSKSTRILDYAANNTDGDYSFCMVHYSGGAADTNIDAWAIYDSYAGAIIDSGRGLPGNSTLAVPVGGGGNSVGGATPGPGTNRTAAGTPVNCLST